MKLIKSMRGVRTRTAVLAAAALAIFAAGWVIREISYDTMTSGTHPQVGLIWSSDVDPTLAPGVNAPPWQLLIRTDTNQIYFKSGTANTAWTSLGGGGGGGGTVSSVACGTNMVCSPSPITTTGTVATSATPTFTTVTLPDGNGGFNTLSAQDEAVFIDSNAGLISKGGITGGTGATIATGTGGDIQSSTTVLAGTDVEAGGSFIFQPGPGQESMTLAGGAITTSTAIESQGGYIQSDGDLLAFGSLSINLSGVSVSLQQTAVDPNGVVTAHKGSLAIESTTPALYQNTNGATTWTAIGGGVSPTVAPSDIYGDASDGNVTISSNTTLTRDMYYDTLTVNVGNVLTTGGFRIFARTAIVNNGTISDKGGDAVLGAAGIGAVSGTLPGGRDGGAGTPSNGQPGNPGGTTPRGYSGAGGTHGAFPNHAGNPGGIGAGGGGGTSTATQGDDGGLAGAALTAVQGDIGLAIFAVWGAGVGLSGNRFLGDHIGGGGASGGGDSFGGVGGGGGGSSGYSIIASPSFTGAGNITANGGNGGNGATPVFGCTNGGGGGGGGYLVIIKGAATAAPTATATGGTAGAPNGGGCFAGGAGGNGVVRTYLSGP